MAKQGSGLAYVARLNVREAIENAKKLKEELNKIGISTSKNFASKPMTEYQAELVRIKQEQLELNKAKHEQAKADRAASLATQKALREEAELIRQRNAEAKKRRPVDISDSQGEIDAANASKSTGGNYTGSAREVYLRELYKDLRANKISLAEYNAELTRLGQVTYPTVSRATKQFALSKKDITKDLEIEKFKLRERNKELKNGVREMMNEKGSLEQRRAALIRLTAVYDRLSAAERRSAAGIRLGEKIIPQLNNQILTLERTTGRAQRNVGNYLSQAWSGLSRIAMLIPGLGIAGLLSLAIDPLMKLVKGMDYFKEKITESKLAQDSMNKALAGSEYTSAVKSVNELRINIDLAKKGVISKEVVLKQYNESIGKTTGQISNLDQAEQALVKNADAYIKMTLYKAAAQIALEEAAKKAFEAEQSRQKKLQEFDNSFNMLTPSEFFQERILGDDSQYQRRRANESGKRKAAEIKENEQQKDKLLKIAEDFQKKSAQIAKGNNFDLFGGKGDNTRTVNEINSRNTLQAKIDELTKKGYNKLLSANEQEVEAVRDKYNKLRAEAERFNSDPINKRKGLRVDVGGLATAEKSEVDVIEDKQATERLKKVLDSQKSLYEEYEQAITKVGKDEADKRYGNLINTGSNYLQGLYDRQMKILLKEGGETDANESQLKLMADLIEQEERMRDKQIRDRYANAYEAAKTHTQQIEQIDREYQENVKALGESATSEQIASLQRERDMRIQSANEAFSEQKSGYAELMADMDKLTRQEIKSKLEAIKDGYRKDYEAGLLTAQQLSEKIRKVNEGIDSLEGSNSFKRLKKAADEYREALEKLNKEQGKSKGVADAEKKLFGAVAEVAGDAAEVVGELGNSFSQLGIGGEGLQKAFNSVGGILEGAGGIAKGLASGNPVDVVKGSIKLLTSAIDMFNTKDKKLEAKIKGYKDQLDSLGKAYKQLERDVSNSVGESFYTDSQKQIANLEQRQKLLTQSLAAEQNKKKADASKIQEYRNQLDEIPNQIEDIKKAISENLIQTSFKDLSNALADAFTEAFSAGEDAAGRLDKVLNNVIANAVKNSLKLKFLDEPIKKFTDELAAYAQNNGNSFVGFDFEAYKKQLADAGALFTEGLKQSEEFFKDVAGISDGGSNSYAGAIKGASQESISLLAGHTSGMRIAQIETNNILRTVSKVNSEIFQAVKDNFMETVKIKENTLRTANNTERLAKIEQSLTSIDAKMNNDSNAMRAAGR